MKKTTILLSTLYTLILFSTVQAQIDSTHFVTTWQTDSAGFSNDSAILIGTNSQYTYDYDVDWDNDGIFDTLGVTADLTIQYPAPGTYTVRIRGVFPAIDFVGSAIGVRDPDKIISIDQWGSINWATFYWAFMDCRNLICTASDAPDLSNVIDMSGMFRGASNFNGNLSDWDVSNVQMMIGVFDEATLFNSDISNWDVSNVVHVGGLFHRASSFNQNIRGWNVSRVKNMGGIFQGATSFNQNIKNWDIDSVSSMAFSFDNCGISRTNYDSILIAWQAKPHQMNVTFGADQMTYCLGDSARSLLIADGWTFVGDNYDCFAIGLEENSWEADVKFYPNPVINQVTIDTKHTVQQVNIYSIVGSIVKSSSAKTLFMEDLPQGNYILEIVTEYGIKKELLVKQ